MHQMTFARLFCRVGPCQILGGIWGRVRDGIIGIICSCMMICDLEGLAYVMLWKCMVQTCNMPILIRKIKGGVY